MLDGMAQRWGVMPHQILDSWIEDLQIDFLCFESGTDAEKKERKKLERKYGARRL